MDWLAAVADAIAKVATPLAWPLAAVVIVFLLRTQLADLLPAIRRLRFGAFEFDFGERINALETKAVQEEILATLPPESLESTRLERLADVAPRAAVLEAWLAVEKEARVAAEKVNLPPNVPIARLVRELQSRRLVALGLAAYVNELREIRNRAVHADDFTLLPDHAERYVTLARQVANVLASAGSEQTQSR